MPGVTLQANKGSMAESWHLAINETTQNTTRILTDGSMIETGMVGAGWYEESKKVQECARLGRVATVCEG